MARLTPAEVRQISHLATLADDHAAQLAAELVVRDYGARELVATEGQDSPGFFQLLSGRARLFRTASEGREQIMRLLQPGDSFGEVAVFDGGSMPATVETLEPASVVLVPNAVFRRLVADYPLVAAELLAHFARRLRSFTELVEQISLQTVQQRVARYLYLAAREEGKVQGGVVTVSRNITLQDLASLVGSVREVVSRTLHSFEEDGVIEVRRGEFLVRDIEALRRLL